MSIYVNDLVWFSFSSNLDHLYVKEGAVFRISPSICLLCDVWGDNSTVWNFCYSLERWRPQFEYNQFQTVAQFRKSKIMKGGKPVGCHQSDPFTVPIGVHPHGEFYSTVEHTNNCYVCQLVFLVHLFLPQGICQNSDTLFIYLSQETLPH